jgi:RsiW-degrading membrane proteinase PrsW (M82 family)
MAEVSGTSVARSPGRWAAALHRWSWLPTLAVGAGLYEMVRWTLQVTGDPLYVPTLILLGATVVPIAFVAFVSGRRLAFGLGARTVGLTALVGGVVGVAVAGLLEFEMLGRFGQLTVIGVGLIEEMAKLLIPAAALLLFRRHRRPADGLLLGVASGAGFAVLETMGYALVALVQSGGNLTLVNGLLLDRGLLSPAAHMAWTGLVAAALWRAATEHWRPRMVVRAIVVYVFVAGLHAAWDSVGSGWAHVGLAVVSLGLLIWTADRLATPDGRRRGRIGRRWHRAATEGRVTTPEFRGAAGPDGWAPAPVLPDATT